MSLSSGQLVIAMNGLPNPHPGEVLREEFLVPLGLSQVRLAREIRVTPTRINRIVNRRCDIGADMAARLARYFGTSKQFWIGLQSDYLEEEMYRRTGDDSGGNQRQI